MLLNKNAWLFVLGLAGVLVVAPGPLCRAWLAHWATQWLGASVDIESAEFSWWPTQLVLHGVSVTNPLKPDQNALALSRVQAEIDLVSSLQGTLQIPLLQITDVQVASPRVVSGALPGVMPRRFFVTDESAALRFPALEFSAGDELFAAESARYEVRIASFQQVLREQLSLWASRVATFPGDAAFDAYRERAAALKRERSLSADARRNATQALKEALLLDIEQLRASRNHLLTQWQSLQLQYAALRQMPAESIAAEQQRLGVSERDLSRLGQALLREKIQEWLNTALAVHQRLVSPVSESNLFPANNVLDDGLTVEHAKPRLLIKKALISGRYLYGAQTANFPEDPLEGELLNLSDVPQALTEPFTLHVQAGGTTAGVVQLSAMLDHRVAGKAVDRFNFSLKSSLLQRWRLISDGAIEVVADSGMLAIDLAGSLAQQQGLDINLSSQLTALTLEVDTKNADNGAARVVADALRATSAITVTARASGEVNHPALELTSSLDDVLATALRSVVSERRVVWQNTLQERLDALLLEQLSVLDADLSEGSAMLAAVENRLRVLEGLHNEWLR